MKTRFGFVSNSSTSSFLIYGVAIDPSNLKDLWLTKEPDSKTDEDDEDDYDDDVYGLLEEKLKNSGLEYHVPDGYDCVYIGASWSAVKDDETGAQFKARVEKMLSDIGITEEPDTLSEAYQS
jgi:hypothetical protein